MTADDIKRFASEFDPQPFHLDEVAAEEDRLQGTCRLRMAHGGHRHETLRVQVRPFGPHPLHGCRRRRSALDEAGAARR